MREAQHERTTVRRHSQHGLQVNCVLRIQASPPQEMELHAVCGGLKIGFSEADIETDVAILVLAQQMLRRLIHI